MIQSNKYISTWHSGLEKIQEFPRSLLKHDLSGRVHNFQNYREHFQCFLWLQMIIYDWTCCIKVALALVLKSLPHTHTQCSKHAHPPNSQSAGAWDGGSKTAALTLIWARTLWYSWEKYDKNSQNINLSGTNGKKNTLKSNTFSKKYHHHSHI